MESLWNRMGKMRGIYHIMNKTQVDPKIGHIRIVPRMDTKVTFDVGTLSLIKSIE